MSDLVPKSNSNDSLNGQNRFQGISNPMYSPNEGETNGLDPKRIISTLLRYKWLVLLFVLAGATGAWFYADHLTPIYESSGALLISSSPATTNDELSQIISQTTGYGTTSTLVNEIEILRSRKFSTQIAQQLVEKEPGDINDFPILWTEQENGEIYRSSVEVVASRIRENLDFMQVEEESDVVEVIFQSPSPLEAAEVVDLTMEIYVENSTRQNRQAAKSTAEFLEEEKEQIEKKLEASEQRLRNYMDSTGLVQVDEQASGMVAERVNTDAELQSINLELENIDQTISNYERQLEKIKPGLSEQFSEAVGPRIRNSQEQLARYENERTLIIAKNPGVLEREQTPARLKYLQEQIERLKGEIANLSDQLFTEDQQFMGIDGEDRAGMVSEIQAQLVDLKIEKNVKSSQRDALVQHKQEMDANINSLPEGMIELAKLQRDVKMNEELYLNVSKQYADMSVWKESQFGFGRIIDPADTPSIPVSPNKKILVLVGLMLGGVLVAGYITTREFLDNSVKSVDQLKTLYLPAFTLSSIPTFEKVSKKDRKTFTVGTGTIPDDMVVLQNRSSLASESIRRLKNNIIYQHGDTPPKTIAVTSPEKGDGKSTVVANLGVVFAEEGYKTLVIDTDFRRPKLQKYFGLNNKSGLSEYLNAQLKIEELIQDSDVNNLKVIAAGKDIKSPESLGNSMTFKQFLKRMEDIFEVIILDTPPFGIISDSSALLKGAEATLIVARYRKTNRGMLLRTIEDLGQIQANVTDIVLNDFDYRKETGSYYGAGYYQTLYSNYEAYVK